MKKILLIIALTATLAACNSNTGDKAADEQEKDYPAMKITAIEDSMSRNFGKGFGTFLAAQIMSDSTSQQYFNKDSFIKGLELVLKCDTSIVDSNFLGGIQQGFVILEQLAELENNNDVTFDHRLVAENVIAAIGNSKQLSEQQIEQLQKDFKASLDKAKNQNLKTRSDAGAKFAADKLAADKALKKLPSGLIYKITKKGSGANFKINDNVMVKYKGMHTDGSVFDQSTEPVAMKLNDSTLIAGFVELLQLMSPGAKAYAIMPAAIAYGATGSINSLRKKDIKGNETIVFEVETVGLADDKK